MEQGTPANLPLFLPLSSTPILIQFGFAPVLGGQDGMMVRDVAEAENMTGSLNRKASLKSMEILASIPISSKTEQIRHSTAETKSLVISVI